LIENTHLSAEEKSAARTFLDQGTLMYARDEMPLTDEEWQQLETLLQGLDYDHVIGGDAAESHSVQVCRFFNDVKKPEALHTRSEQILALVMSPKMRRFYRRFTGSENLCLRRCQANLMQTGDYIGVHKDQDSNPDYIATVVFHFADDYRGGDFVTHDSRSSAQHFHPPAHTVLVNNCTIPHEVAPVEQGSRLTLACFLSTEFGPSRNQREDFQLNQ
jgi:Rps23 Pro-64 3,4-dihydroxylase Tpa1-like proline 4-hydroxylase